MRNILSLLTFLLFVLNAAAQQRFQKEIQAFKSIDSANGPKQHVILFIGSSSFTNWTDVQAAFPDRKVTNRAFGGSALFDQVNYVEQIVYPHSPKQVVVYCGENDIAGSDTVTGKVVYDRFVTLFQLIRKKFPKTHIAFVSMKPSPSRQMMLPRMQEGNALIKKFLSRKKRTAYIDVYQDMIDDEGKPRQELFLKDNLHMNKEGYKIWQRIIAPYLVKN